MAIGNPCTDYMKKVYGQKMGPEYLDQILGVIGNVLRNETDPVGQVSMLREQLLDIGSGMAETSFQTVVSIMREADFIIKHTPDILAIPETNAPKRLKAIKNKLINMINIVASGDTSAEGAKLSAENRHKVLITKYATLLNNAIRSAGLEKAYQDPALYDDVVRILSTPRDEVIPNVGPNADAVNAIAGIMRRILDDVYLDRKNSGLSIKFNDGYFPRTHDGAKIVTAGFDVWATKLLNALRVSKSFASHGKDATHPIITALHDKNFDINNFRDNSVIKYLKEKYTRYASRVTSAVDPSDFSEMIMGLESSDLASKKLKDMMQDRAFIFRDTEAWLGYNRDFGRHSDLPTAMNGYLFKSAKEVALAGTFSAMPKQFIDSVFKRYAKVLPGVNSAEMDNAKNSVMEHLRGFTGEATAGEAANMWHRTSRLLKPIAVMTRLMYSAFAQVGDWGVMATAAFARTGGGVGFLNTIPALMRTGQHLIGGLKDVLTHSEISQHVDIMLDTYAYMIDGSDYSKQALKSPDTLSKLTDVATTGAQFAMKMSGTSFMNRWHHTAARRMALANFMSDSAMAAQDYDFKRFNIQQSDLKFLKKHIKDVDGNFYNIVGLPDAEFANNPRGLKPDEYKNLMATHLEEYVSDFMRSAVLSPTNKDAVAMRIGQEAGWKRVLAKEMFFQFKSIFVAAMHNLQDQMGAFNHSRMQNVSYLGYSSAAITATTFLGMYMKDLSKNKFDHDAVMQKYEEMGAGLYAKLLFSNPAMSMYLEGIMTPDGSIRKDVMGYARSLVSPIAVAGPLQVATKSIYYTAASMMDMEISDDEIKSFAKDIRANVPFNKSPWYDLITPVGDSMNDFFSGVENALNDTLR